MKMPGCCYCFDTQVPGGYDQDQRIKIPYGRKDLPFEIACVARRPPEVGDIFVWDDRIRVIRQVVDHTDRLGNLFALETGILPLPNPAHGFLVKQLNGEGTMTTVEQLEESLKQSREKRKKLEEQRIEILITEDDYPTLFKEFRTMAEEGTRLHPNDVGTDVICKRADTDFEKALLDTGVTFTLKFKDDFSCKIVLV